MTAVSMKDWTVSVVQQWFESMSNDFGSHCTSQVVNICAVKNITGLRLMQFRVSNANLFSTKFGVLPVFAEMYCEKIRDRMLEDIGQKSKVNYSSNIRPRNFTEFHLSIFFRCQRKILSTAVNSYTTIQTVKEMIHVQEIAPIGRNDASTIANKLLGMTLLSHGKVLQPTVISFSIIV